MQSIAQEQLDGKSKWNKLVVFLKADLKAREALVLDERISKITGGLEGRDSEKPKDNHRQLSGNQGNRTDKLGSDKRSNSFTSNQDLAATRVACVLCGKDKDHVISLLPDKTATWNILHAKILLTKRLKKEITFF